MSSERQIIDIETPWWGEHVHRYDVAIEKIKGTERILDIACGSGFGSNLLAENTKGKVIGGDLSEEAIQISKSHWSRENLEFLQMDATALKFEKNYFDKIISFETIEHSTKFHEMLEEFKRVIKPDGIIYLSTPNKRINSPNGEIINPFHTQEWYLKEFKELLNNHFKNFDLFGQQYSRYINDGDIIQQIEKFFYLRGARKTPLNFKNHLFKRLGYESFYPTNKDYSMVDGEKHIEKCKTFFAICKI